jgi:hypothetical protein
MEGIAEYIEQVLGIKYNNRHGPAYAYVQFLAFSREIPQLLREQKGMENEVVWIESLREIFNEQLTEKFSEEQQRIFENSIDQLRFLSHKLMSGVDEKALA